MSNPETPAANHRALLLVLGSALIAFAVKCAWALNSWGSSDLMFFQSFAEQLTKSGLAETYRNNAMFNHTPMTALLLRALFWGSQGELAPFSSAFRFLTAIADLGSLAGLLYLQRKTGRPPWWALALFAASPVSIMVSGFHGNVDPFMVLFLVWTAVALIERRPALCGVLFALACQVKIVPILLTPLFLCWWWQQDRRGFWKFSVAAGAALLLGSAVPLVECPAAYLHNVFGYGGYWGTWGVTYWLHQTGAAVFQTVAFKGLTPAQDRISFDLKLLLIAGILTLAWRRRVVGGPQFLTTLAAAFVVFFVFAPGLGPQYLVWVAPFLAWSKPRWYAVVTLCSAAYMFSFYHPSSNYVFPWDFAFPKGPEIAVWGPWMNLSWAAFIALLAIEGRRWCLVSSPIAASDPPSPASVEAA